MTLGNMRANGVRTLLVYCVACHRDAVLDVEACGDDVPGPAFSPRMVCTGVRDGRRRHAAKLGRVAAAWDSAMSTIAGETAMSRRNRADLLTGSPILRFRPMKKA